MAITPQSAIQVSGDGAFLAPQMDAQPLQRALENLNYLWQWHRPPLVDVCPTADLSSRHEYFVYPVTPSGDNLRYTFEHTLETLASTTVTVTVRGCTAYTGVSTYWSVLYTSTTPAIAAGAPYTQIDTGIVIPHDTQALQFEFQGTTTSYFAHHILVYPAPAAPGAGITTAGFTPFDDGLLAGAAGAAIHTEFLNRCKLSSLIVLRDRRQQVLSFVQKETGTPPVPCSWVASALTNDFQDLPRVRLVFPFQSPNVVIEVSALADVTGGATTGMVRVRQVGVVNGRVALFNADGTVQTQPLMLTLQNVGALQSYADVAIGAKCTYTTNTYVRAVSGCWRPGDYEPPP